MAQPSTILKDFSKIPGPRIQRSVFNRSHAHKTTMGPKWLYPLFVDEVLPGDTISMQAAFFGRLSTLLHPSMDNAYLDCFAFFVPNRLLWNNWEKFLGAQDEAAQSQTATDYELPYIYPSEGDLNFDEFSIFDYMGLPTQVNILEADAPRADFLRAYQRTWNDWFRDQNFQNALTLNLDDGPDQPADYYLLPRGKRHDYFTSCLPWPQRGDAVSVPLGTFAPVIGNGMALGLSTYVPGESAGLTWSNSDTKLYLSPDMLGNQLPDTAADTLSAPNASGVGVTNNPETSGLIADLGNATAATVYELRERFAMQHFLERMARTGTRYTEIIHGVFGIQVPDYRLQRAEYLGSYSQKIDIRQVAQTSETGSTPQGNLAAYGTATNVLKFNKSFVEHGIVMILANLRADITYQQGIDRKWTRRTKWDIYVPDLAHLGEQAVHTREIYYPNNGVFNEEVFGYQERWAEYRSARSYITAAMRSNFTQSLDTWHYGVEFASEPALGPAFIVDEPEIWRALGLNPNESDPEWHQALLLDCYFSISHARPMPIYSVPGLERL